MKTENSHSAGAAAPIPQNKEQMAEMLTKPFQGPLEALAQQSGLSMKDIVECLPAANRSHIEGSRFVEILETLSTWGDVLLIVNTDAGVFECKGPIARGSVGLGYYNLGHGSPISGHLKYDRCRDIFCVRRSFHNLDTCSIQFFDEKGDCMFKLFVSRDEKRKLNAAQVALFEKLSGLAAS